MKRTLAAFLLAVAAGCTGTGVQDVLAPEGPQAAAIARWFWISIVLAVLVYVGFLALLAIAVRRGWRTAAQAEEVRFSAEQGNRLVVLGGVAVPAVILLTLLALSGFTDRQISRLGRGPGSGPLTIRIVGHQFWWELQYVDKANPHRQFITANELHIPAGRPVRLLLESRDVIHSFWVPNLHGKVDLIPGRTNDIVLRADRPGVFRGQCAEFCGIQHAKMAMLVVAHTDADFDAWWERQLRPHAPPDSSQRSLVRGEEVFMSRGCAVCHGIRGTAAHGRVAPDLSYFGERRTIAAGTLPNTRGHLGGWIGDPQSIKPGSFMPAVALDGDDLQSLLDYLLSLR